MSQRRALAVDQLNAQSPHQASFNKNEFKTKVKFVK